MDLQIDLKPRWNDPNHGYTMNLYIDGRCFTSSLTAQGARDLVQAGIVHQVKGKRRIGDTEEREEFEYENKVDGSGVQYTSKTFELYPVD